MKTLSQIIGILLLGTLLISCSSEGSNSNSTKPKARGSIGEIILVIDSAKYAGPVGDALKDVVDQAGDVAGAVKGKPRRGRKPKKDASK